MSDSPELLKPSAEVTDSELQIELGNLKAENETLKADYAKLLESSTVVANNLRQEVQKLRSQLDTERTERADLEEELEMVERASQEWGEIANRRLEDLEKAREELSGLKQKSATASELSEAADLLNQLKGLRKKSKADLADIEVILELLSQADSLL